MFSLDERATASLPPARRAWLLQCVAAVADAATQVGRSGVYVPTAYLPVAVAQGCHESAWGEHMPNGSHNPFGIKARPGEPFVNAMTWEHVNGHDVRVPQPFRKFDSLAAAFVRHCRLLCTAPVYAAAQQHGDDPDAFARALTGVYATDPHYHERLIALMHTYGLLATFGFVGAPAA